VTRDGSDVIHHIFVVKDGRINILDRDVIMGIASKMADVFDVVADDDSYDR